MRFILFLLAISLYGQQTCPSGYTPITSAGSITINNQKSYGFCMAPNGLVFVNGASTHIGSGGGYGLPVSTFGDSVTLGIAASPISDSYVNLLTSKFNWTLSNLAVSATQILDWVQIVLEAPVADASASIFQAALNDSRFFGGNENALTFNQQVLESEAAYMAIPDSQKIKSYASFPGSQITYTGTWFVNSGFSNIASTTTNGSTATWQATGSIIYICLVAVLGDSSTTQVIVDGIDKGAFSNQNVNTIISAAGASNGTFLIKITGLSSSQHSVTIRANGTNGTFFCWSAGLNDALKAAWPKVWMGNTIRLNSAGYAADSPFNNATDDIVALYNTYIRRTAIGLGNDGLNVYYVDGSANYNPNDPAEIAGDNVHPTNLGHYYLYQAYLKTMLAGPAW